MENTKELAKAESLPEQATPDQLLTLAINKDLDIEKLEKLMELRERYEAGQARKMFFESLTKFQSTVPEIRKTREADFGGGGAKYKYAPLADIVRQIKETVKECELAYRWEIADDGENIKVTCIIAHSSGHTESTTMSAKADVSGKKNPIQARGSAIEYMKRYTLIGALGLSTTDTDIDALLPQIDIDLLHKQYMVHFNELIQIDPKCTKWDPDNWKTERTAKVYMKAIDAIREELVKRKGAEA
jgi:hypothetical protein